MTDSGIVVGTDGSPTADAAIRWAAEDAARLAAGRVGIPVEVLLIDNGSTDETPQLLASFAEFPGTKVISEPVIPSRMMLYLPRPTMDVTCIYRSPPSASTARLSTASAFSSAMGA